MLSIRYWYEVNLLYSRSSLVTYYLSHLKCYLYISEVQPSTWSMVQPSTWSMGFLLIALYNHPLIVKQADKMLMEGLWFDLNLIRKFSIHFQNVYGLYAVVTEIFMVLQSTHIWTERTVVLLKIKKSCTSLNQCFTGWFPSYRGMGGQPVNTSYWPVHQMQLSQFAYYKLCD